MKNNLNNIGLIDSHCHLSFKELGAYDIENNNTSKFLNLAKNNGVKAILNIILQENLLETALSFNFDEIKIFHSFGIHPNNSEDEYSRTVTKENFINKIKSLNNKIIAIGECGLDYFYENYNRNNQIKLFEMQCEVASELNLPIIIHTRKSLDNTLSILKSFVKNNNLKGVIHCFSEDTEAVKQFLDIDFFISFSGIVTFKNAKSVQEAAKFVPLNKLLLETDSPYLAPTPYRGQVNHPANVKNIYEFMAILKNIELNEIAISANNNFCKLFKVYI